jgi:CDP-paratose 2-epimerase
MAKEGQRMRYLIVGGAGFIGVNAAYRYAQRGHAVTILDDFSRAGTTENKDWLLSQYPAIRVVRADIRTDLSALDAAAGDCDVLLHLAAQVAVTTSVANPRADFEINALGSFNVLEAARKARRSPIVLYSSTNKVYGGMEDVAVDHDDARYRYRDLPHGVPETQQLDFHSPYGCSKGAADQYVRDYARIYGMRTVVFRQSCIYGPHQFGIEDQGWVAWFALRSLLNQPVTIYGDGRQVRDVLYVDDLLAVFDAALERIEQVSGRVYNIGGGPDKILSLLDLVGLLDQWNPSKLRYTFGDWRPGDQRVYVSDIRRAERELGWRPATGPAQGVRQMVDWMAGNLSRILPIYNMAPATAPAK